MRAVRENELAAEVTGVDTLRVQVPAFTMSAALALLMLRLTEGVPRSVFLLAPILLAGLMCGSRLAYRAWREYRSYGLAEKVGEPVLVLGGRRLRVDCRLLHCVVDRLTAGSTSGPF